MARIKEIVMVDKCLNKHGKIKGKNKKDTKLKRTSCVHHKYNRKGNLRNTCFPISDNQLQCKRCGAVINTVNYSKKDVKEAIEPVIEILESNKFVAAATNAGQSVVSYLVQTENMVKQMPKVSGKLSKIASKRSSVKNRKKKHDSYDSSKYGNWSKK